MNHFGESEKSKGKEGLRIATDLAGKMGGAIITQEDEDPCTVSIILKTKMFTSTRAVKAFKERMMKNKEQQEELAKNEAYLLRNNVSFEKARKD